MGEGSIDYLLAHHFPNRYSRTISVGHVHLCARCTGQVIGIVSVAVTAVVLSSIRPDFGGLSTLLAVALLPLPAAVDWTTQAVGARESRNGIRLVTGALLGAAIAVWFVPILHSAWWWYIGGPLILLGYSGTILGVLTRRKVIERVVEEHFPS